MQTLEEIRTEKSRRALARAKAAEKAAALTTEEAEFEVILRCVECPTRGSSLRELYNWYRHEQGLSDRRSRAYAQEQHREERKAKSKPSGTSYNVEKAQEKDLRQRAIPRVPEFQGVTSGYMPDRRDRHHRLACPATKAEAFVIEKD